VAHGGDDTARLVDIAGDVVDGQTCREVPHCAVTASDEDGGVVFRIDVGKARRVANGVAEAFAVPVAGIGRVIEVEAVDGRLAAIDRGELDLDAGGIEDGEGMGDFAEVEACGFAGFAVTPWLVRTKRTGLMSRVALVMICS
jgi:hypothetical protein